MLGAWVPPPRRTGWVQARPGEMEGWLSAGRVLTDLLPGVRAAPLHPTGPWGTGWSRCVGGSCTSGRQRGHCVRFQSSEGSVSVVSLGRHYVCLSCWRIFTWKARINPARVVRKAVAGPRSCACDLWPEPIELLPGAAAPAGGAPRCRWLSGNWNPTVSIR